MISQVSPSPLRERMAQQQGETSTRRTAAHWLEHQTSIKRQVGSHQLLQRAGWPDYVFAFHDREEIGPKMLAKVAKKTGLRPEDL